jgi:hypothetical protein
MPNLSVCVTVSRDLTYIYLFTEILALHNLIPTVIMSDVVLNSCTLNAVGRDQYTIYNITVTMSSSEASLLVLIAFLLWMNLRIYLR